MLWLSPSQEADHQRTFYYHTKRLSEPDGYDDARAAICKIYDHHLVKELVKYIRYYNNDRIK